jgi:hypothetical protein
LKELRDELLKENAERAKGEGQINIINSVVTGSNIIAAQDSASVLVTVEKVCIYIFI